MSQQTKVTPWNVEDYLTTPDEIEAFMDEANKTGDKAFIDHCQSIVTRVRKGAQAKPTQAHKDKTKYDRKAYNRAMFIGTKT